MNTGRSLGVWMQSGDRLRLREGVDFALMAVSLDIPVSVCLAGAALARLREDLTGKAMKNRSLLGPLRSLGVYGMEVIFAFAEDPLALSCGRDERSLPLRFLDAAQLRAFFQQHELWYRV